MLMMMLMMTKLLMAMLMMTLLMMLLKMLMTRMMTMHMTQQREREISCNGFDPTRPLQVAMAAADCECPLTCPVK